MKPEVPKLCAGDAGSRRTKTPNPLPPVITIALIDLVLIKVTIFVEHILVEINSSCRWILIHYYEAENNTEHEYNWATLIF